MSTPLTPSTPFYWTGYSTQANWDHRHRKTGKGVGLSLLSAGQKGESGEGGTRGPLLVSSGGFLSGRTTP